MVAHSHVTAKLPPAACEADCGLFHACSALVLSPTQPQETQSAAATATQLWLSLQETTHR